MESTTVNDLSRGVGLTWNWKDSHSSVEVSFNGNTPSSTIVLIQPHFSQSLTLGQVIAAFGEPSHVLVSSGPGAEPTSPQVSSISFIYLDHGISLHTKATVQPSQPLVSPDVQLTMVNIFEPGELGYNRAMGRGLQDKLSLVAWQGYKDFSLYCKLTYPHESELCG